MEKKEIYIYIYSWTKCIVRVSTGWRQVALLRRRQDNVHSLAGVVLAYSLFFQLASSCSTSSRIVWMVCINRMASLIRRLEPWCFWRIALLFPLENAEGKNRWKFSKMWENCLNREAFQKMTVFCGVELSLLSWMEKIDYFIRRELNVLEKWGVLFGKELNVTVEQTFISLFNNS